MQLLYTSHINLDLLQSHTSLLMSTELQYREILPQRAVEKDAFPRGVQNFLWSVGQPTSFIPSKTYLRYEVTVYSSNTAETQPKLKDLIAPADNCIANCYNNASVSAGGKVISQIVTGLPQASALKARLLSSAAQQDSIGMSAYMHEGEFAKRQQMVCSDGQFSSLSDDYELRPLTTVVVNQRTATVAISAPTAVTPAAGAPLSPGGVVTGGGTAATATQFDLVAAVGDTLVVGGQQFQITAIATALGMTVSPAPTAAIAATADAYIVRQRPSVSQ